MVLVMEMEEDTSVAIKHLQKVHGVNQSIVRITVLHLCRLKAN